MKPRSAELGHLLRTGALLVLHALPARGQERTTPARTFHVEYDAPAECGGAERFVREVGTRSTRIAVSTEGELVRVAITRPQGVAGFSGRMSIGEAEESTRELVAEDCRDLLSGLALALVLAVDPESLTRPPEPITEITPPLSSSESPPPAMPNAVPEPVSVPWFLGFLTTVGTTPAPVPVVGVGAFVERGGWLAVRVAGTAEFGAARSTPDYVVRFQMFGAALSGCPMTSPSAGFAVGGCATANLGLVRAETTVSTLTDPLVSVRPRFDVALGPAIAARVAGVRISLIVELTVPLLRDEFVISVGGTDQLVHQADPLGARATLAFGFPLGEYGELRVQ